MFWGLIMEPMRRYTQTLKRPFRVTMAVLDVSSATNEPTQVIFSLDNRNYVLCTLQKDKTIQCQLDLCFDRGDEVSFTASGKNHVHLTGYMENDMDESDEDIEDEEETETGKQSKEESNKKRKGSEMKNESKKLKTAIDLLGTTITDEDESDDSDFNLNNLVEEDSDEDDEDVEEEEDQDDVSAEEEDDDEDDESEEVEEDNDDEELKLKDDTKSSMNGNVSKAEISHLNKSNKTPKKSDYENEKTPQRKQQSDKKTPSKETPQKRVIEGGVIVQDLKVGDGQIAKPGRFVHVYYEGRLQKNNKMFDSTNKGAGFRFRLGKQEVIKGWDVGVAGMKVGGKRRITCPPQMAYGKKGSPPTIPPNSTLVFEVELKNIT